jgi:anaerobic selenocysteine-containing dehydrogenase
MSTVERVTFCRICEAACGLVATVEQTPGGERLVQLRPDQEHPLSRGFACPKGIAMTDVQNDPDRVLRPLRRRPGGAAGDFEEVSWAEALDDIGTRLSQVYGEHGGEAIGWYFGNPTAFSYSHVLWLQGAVMALGIRHLYSAGSQDVNNRFVASRLLYGAATAVPIPDLAHTDFLLMIGANPVVSHGSLISAPRMKEDLKDVVLRGGRVVVVDPRRSETAALFEHLPVRPDGDAWLLLSLLEVVFAQGLADEAAIAEQSTGIEALRVLAADFPPEHTEAWTGLAATEVRQLARALATAPRAAVYGRTGSCLGNHGTLVSWLMDALALVTGNLDRRGGSVFGRNPIPLELAGELTGVLSYDRRRSRVGDFPDVLGTWPAALMAKEIRQPGPGQLRALLLSAGNPMLSVPDGCELESALAELDLSVSLDLYVNETNKHCDYVLPATTWLEREDVPVASLSFFAKPFIQHTDAVVAPYGEARPEWRVIEDLLDRMGVVPFVPTRLLSPGGVPPGVGRVTGRVLAAVRRRLPVRLTPDSLLDAALRAGTATDRGARLSLRRLRRHPHGLVLADDVAVGRLRDVVRHRGGRVRLEEPLVRAEVERLRGRSAPGDGDHPLQLIGMRELRSQNSWMHNAPTLMRGKRRHGMRIHPKDAAGAGVSDGDLCEVRSPYGRIEVPAVVTEEMREGTVAVPHGWGHDGGWRRANAAGGANVNQLASTDPADLERLAGMAVLNGIPVSVTPL